MNLIDSIHNISKKRFNAEVKKIIKEIKIIIKCNIKDGIKEFHYFIEKWQEKCHIFSVAYELPH